MLRNHQVQMIWHGWTIFLLGYVKRQSIKTIHNQIVELKDKIWYAIRGILTKDRTSVELPKIVQL